MKKIVKYILKNSSYEDFERNNIIRKPVGTINCGLSRCSLSEKTEETYSFEFLMIQTILLGGKLNKQILWVTRSEGKAELNSLTVKPNRARLERW